jgi:hypothetical protein
LAKTASGAEPTSAQDPANSPFPVVAHDANEYNWSGFSCPYRSATSFISCGGGHLVCDGAIELRNGRRFHQCYCGHAGFIEGSIKTYSAHHHSVDAEVGNAPPLTDQFGGRRKSLENRPPEIEEFPTNLM